MFRLCNPRWRTRLVRFLMFDFRDISNEQNPHVVCKGKVIHADIIEFVDNQTDCHRWPSVVVRIHRIGSLPEFLSDSICYRILMKRLKTLQLTTGDSTAAAMVLLFKQERCKFSDNDEAFILVAQTFVWGASGVHNIIVKALPKSNAIVNCDKNIVSNSWCHVCWGTYGKNVQDLSRHSKLHWKQLSFHCRS